MGATDELLNAPKEKLIGVIRELEGNVEGLRKLGTDLRLEIAEAKRANLEQRANDVHRGQGGQFDAFVHRTARGPVLRMQDDRVRVTEDDGSSTEQSLPGLLDAETINEWHGELKRLSFARAVCRAAQKPTPGLDSRIRTHLRKCPNELREVLTEGVVSKLFAQTGGSIKRIFSDVSGVGDSWIPDVHAPLLFETMTMQRNVEALFDVINMPDKNMIFPYKTYGLRPYVKGQAATNDPGAFNASTMSLTSNAVTAVGLAVRAIIDEDANEDSILAGLQQHQMAIAQALQDASEDAIINGDTAASHQDTISTWDIRSRWGSSGLGGANDHRRVWLGLRAQAFDASNTVDLNATQTYAGVTGLRSGLASPMGVGDQVVLLVSPEFYLAKILAFSELVTLEKYGNQAVLAAGEIGKLGNMRVVVTEFLSPDLATTGLYTGSGTTTGALVVNRARWFMGSRRGVVLEQEKDISTGVYTQVATVRKVFAQKAPASALSKSVRYAFNLSIS